MPQLLTAVESWETSDSKKVVNELSAPIPFRSSQSFEVRNDALARTLAEAPRRRRMWPAASEVEKQEQQSRPGRESEGTCTAPAMRPSLQSPHFEFHNWLGGPNRVN